MCQPKYGLTGKIFVAIIIRMGTRGRPPKAPEDRRTDAMRIPLTAEEKQIIESGAEAHGAKPVTWIRELALRAARRKGK